MSYEYFAKLARIIKRLKEKTLDGETLWEPTPSAGTFQVSFPDYSVVVTETVNPSTENYEYGFQIRNSEGDLVEAITDELLAQESRTEEDLISDLHRVARRSALGADEAVEKVLEYLGA